MTPAVMDRIGPVEQSSIEFVGVENCKAVRKRRFRHGGVYSHLVEVYEMKLERPSPTTNGAYRVELVKRQKADETQTKRTL